MGSRGTFSKSYGKTGGIPPENREYTCIGWLAKIKVIVCDTKSNNPTPTYSNTANTTYFSYSKENKSIEHIYYYRNHKLYKSVDFKSNEIPHTHYWHNNVVGRKKHDKKNTFAPNDRDKRLIKIAQNYNRQKRNG